MSSYLNTSMAEICKWVEQAIGPQAMDKRERVFRLLEEAVELFQAEGMTAEQATKVVAFVFAKPVGDPTLEAGGVFCTFLAYCGSAGFDPAEILEIDLFRMRNSVAAERIPRIRKKVEAGISLVRFNTPEAK